MRRVFITRAVLTQCNEYTSCLCKTLAGLRRILITRAQSSVDPVQCNEYTSCLCNTLAGLRQEGRFKKYKVGSFAEWWECYMLQSSCKSVFFSSDCFTEMRGALHRSGNLTNLLTNLLTQKFATGTTIFLGNNVRSQMTPKWSQMVPKWYQMTPK